jgi:predicted component of type VI protein secretion system
MINYLAASKYLDLALSGSDYSQLDENRVKIFYRLDGADMTSQDEINVQSLLDNYDPLPKFRERAKQRLIEEFEQATLEIESAYPEVEKRTFIKQEDEARAFIADNTTPTPTLTPIAQARSLTVQEIANRVIIKADTYTAQVSALIGLRQAKEDQIDIETDLDVLETISLV